MCRGVRSRVGRIERCHGAVVHCSSARRLGDIPGFVLRRFYAIRQCRICRWDTIIMSSRLVAMAQIHLL